MSIVTEIYKTARNQEVDLSLMEALKAREQAELEIITSASAIGKLEIIDLIAMMAPIAVAPMKKPEYFGKIFGDNPSQVHATVLSQRDLAEMGDVQRIIQAITGSNKDQKYLISIKADPNSPAGFTVNKFMLLIDTDQIKASSPEVLEKLIQTTGLPEGLSVKELYKTNLQYHAELPRFQEMLTSNLLITYYLTALAAKDAKVFTGNFTYRVHPQAGRSTYMADEGEVLFELKQTDEVLTSWFDIFDQVELEDFDLNSELTKHINHSVQLLAEAKG